MFEIGQKVAHFEILRKIGEGGMGEVYLVQDTKLNRKAAMKVQHLDTFEDKERRERFIREAQTAAQISHPNIMAIFDMGIVKTDESQEISYIVMEYLPGRSLSDILRNSEYDIGDMMRLAEKIASGLAAAHRMNIVHRDIKADNIIIDENGEPKILDFGLAKTGHSQIIEPDNRSAKTISQELTTAGKILGTVSYMSPEQARGEKVDIRSDVFSFGILLYKMVTGEFPFDGPTQVSTLAKILEAQPAPPHEKNENIPTELERIIAKCLQKNAADRYQGASDLAVDLRHVRKQFDSGVTETISGIDSVGGRKSGKISKSIDGIGFFRKNRISVTVGALVLFSALVYFQGGLFSNGGGRAEMKAQDNSLAILGFDNKTGDESFDWLKTGLPEILLTDLAQSSSLKVFSQERILDFFPDRKAEHSHEEFVKAANSLGASKLLSGTFYKLGDQIRIDARLEDVATGEIILTEKVIGADAFSLVDSLTTKLASSLNIKNLENIGDVRLYTSSSEEAYKHYLKGLEQFMEQRWEKARESFGNALKIDSTFAMPYMRIGMSYIFEGRTVQGREYFKKARQYQDRLPQRDRNLLDIYTDLWVNQEFNEAFTKMEVFVNNQPDDKEGRAIYGLLIWSFQKDTSRAFAQIDTALQLDPFFLPAQMFQISIARQSGNISKVIATAENIKKYSPESPLAYDELARAYRSQGKYREAINELKQLYSSYPEQKVYLEEISRLFILTREFDSADFYVAKYGQASGVDPYELSNYYEALSNLQSWQGEFHGVINSMKHAAENSFKTGDSNVVMTYLAQLSVNYYRIQKIDSALHYAQKSHSWASSFSKVAYPLMLLEMDYDNRDEAKKIFQKVLPELRTKMPSDLMPVIEEFNKMFEAAYEADTAGIIAALDAIVKGQRNTPTSQNSFNLAQLNVKNGNYARGRELLLPFVEGNEQSSNGFVYVLANYYLGRANEGLNKKKDAIKNYTEVLKFWNKADIQIKEIKDARERLAKLTA